MSVDLRPLDVTDGEAVLALWNRNARFDPLTPALLAEKVWDDLDFTPALALAVEEAGRLVGFAFGVVRQGDAGPRGHVKLIAVDAPARRQGIGGRLLAALEAGFRAAGARSARPGEAAPNYLSPGIDVRYTKALLLFEKHGYVRTGEAINLTAELQTQDFATDEDEARLAEAGFAVRRARAADWDPLMAFLAQHWPAWQAEVGRSLTNNPPAVHLAWQGDAVVGFSAYDGNNIGTGWFGPMGTDPVCRGRGVGRVLLRRCLRDLKAQGLARAIIPWVAPIAFYAHHADADIARVFWRYEKRFG